MGIIEYIGLTSIILLCLMGSPLVVAFSIGPIIILLVSMGLPVSSIAQLFFSTINSYTLLAVPFFILAGNILVRSGGMVPLRDFMNAVIGKFSGGLAVASIVFATFLGSISGSSAACLSIIGVVIVPILVDSGYERSFASGLAVTSAGLGLLIPPSLFFIIFGSFNQVSIADLFLAGIGPGVLSMVLMSIVAVIIAKRRNYVTSQKTSVKEQWHYFIKVIPMLLMPLVVLGGIYSGIFSPTQAATVSVFYAILVGALIYRGLTWKFFILSLVETAKISSMIYLLYIGGDIFGKVLSYIKLPQMISDFVIALNFGPMSFLLIVEGLLLIMGFFFSSIPMVVIVLPLFMPSVINLGIDPVFYGCLAVYCSIIGEVTPPFGPQLWIAAPICKESMGTIIREASPFLIAQVIALLLATFIPPITMGLVNLMR